MPQESPIPSSLFLKVLRKLPGLGSPSWVSPGPHRQFWPACPSRRPRGREAACLRAGEDECGQSIEVPAWERGAGQAESAGDWGYQGQRPREDRLQPSRGG